MNNLRGRVLSVGSINADVMFRVHDLVRAGETLPALESNVTPGGKSANQAVAAARLGSTATLIAAVGADSYGTLACREVALAGVNVDYVSEMDGVPTGLAFICVDDAGENTIVLSSGANAALTSEHVHRELFEKASVVTLCFEVDQTVASAAAKHAHNAGTLVILNLSPAQRLDETLRALVDVLVVNEIELETATGIKPIFDDAFCRALMLLGVPTLVVTLGAAGVTVVTRDESGAPVVYRVSSIAIHAVDTTGCGDAFVGALASELAEGLPIREAVRTAALVGAYAATRFGAQPSYPTREGLNSWIESLDVSV